MTTECYYHQCVHHPDHNKTVEDEWEGPFCHYDTCLATEEELEKFARMRRQELLERKFIDTGKR